MQLIAGSLTFQRVQVRASDVMIPFVVLLGLNCLVLALWTGIDPLYWDRNVVAIDPYDRTVESSGRCVSNHMAAFAGPLLAINGCALILALWQAYVGRGITTEFSESRYIASTYVARISKVFGRSCFEATQANLLLFLSFSVLQWRRCAYFKRCLWGFPSFSLSEINQQRSSSPLPELS